MSGWLSGWQESLYVVIGMILIGWLFSTLSEISDHLKHIREQLVELNGIADEHRNVAGFIDDSVGKMLRSMRRSNPEAFDEE